MRIDPKMLVAGAAAIGLAGCAPVDASYGEALRYDMAAQTVDPDPVYPENGAKPGSDGQHGAKAAERYRKGQTKAVAPITISSGGAGPQ